MVSSPCKTGNWTIDVLWATWSDPTLEELQSVASGVLPWAVTPLQARAWLAQTAGHAVPLPEGTWQHSALQSRAQSTEALADSSWLFCHCVRRHEANAHWALAVLSLFSW